MKLREPILYIIFGGLTTVVNLLIYQSAVALGIPYGLANGIAFVMAVLFAYYTNKHFVFESQAKGISEQFSEMAKFFISRLGTFFVETAGLWIMIEWMNMNTTVPKYLMTVVVVLLNYFLSKWVIFRKTT